MADRFELTVRSSRGDYGILIARGAASELASPADGKVTLVDERFAGRFAGPLVAVRADEAAKTLTRAEEVMARMAELGVTRSGTVTAVGGGVIQDLATLVASLYMRGIAWSYAPTTLLGMVDSCVGGKSAINVGPWKNLAGNFHPPVAIAVDPDFLTSLSAVDIAGGVCEAAKISWCGGRGDFDRYVAYWSAWRDGGPPEPFIAHVLDVKRRFVEEDEFDRGVRRLLNFGHTFGHALESATSFAVPHGIAVGVGICCALRLAEEDLDAHPLAVHVRTVLDESGFPREHLKELDEERFTTAFRADKKHAADAFRLILPAGSGVVEQALPADEKGIRTVRAAVAATVDALCQ